MNKLILIAAVLLAGAATSLNASTTDSSNAVVRHVPGLQVPIPSHVVSPKDLPRWCINQRVDVQMTIDAYGVPHQIRLCERMPLEVCENLTAALEQWRFSPARQDGRPIALRVILPVLLAEQ